MARYPSSSVARFDQQFAETPDEMSERQRRARMQIWEVEVSDGITKYFWDKGEADFYYHDTMKAGFGVRIAPIPVPQTPKAFAAFMEDQFAKYRELIVAAKRVTGD